MKLKALALLIFMLISAGILFGQASADKDNALNLETNLNRFFEVNFDEPQKINIFLWRLFISSDVRGGIVFGKNEDIFLEKRISKPENMVLSSILNAFSESTGYSWSESDNVVNVASPDPYTILDTRITRFKVAKATPSEFRTALLNTPEFQKYRKKNKLVDTIPGNPHGFLIIGPIGRISDRNRVSIDRTNSTVRELLNESVRLRDLGVFWTYREYEVEHEGITYNFYRLEN